MRVLVAGRNAKVLAQAAGALSDDVTMATATSKADALALLDDTEFDLVVACENLGDGSGLEVLSHVAVTTPNTLRIFAARPATLELLKGELGLFGLFRTLPYPINFPTLWAAMSLARSCSASRANPTAAAATPPPVRHVVLEETWDGPAAIAVQEPMAVAPPQVSVVPSTATTEVRIGTATSTTTTAKALARAAASAASAKARATAVASSVTKAASSAARTAAAVKAGGAGNATPGAVTPKLPAPDGRSAERSPTRIPETEAFRRALARRNEAKRRQEPSVNSESLDQLARLTAARRPTHLPRPPMPGNRRTALFVGSGVFAAAAAVILTFLMLRTNSSMPGAPLPLVASVDPGVTQDVPAWAPAPPPGIQPTSTYTPPSATETEPPQEAEPSTVRITPEEAAQLANNFETGHPPPPQPNPPPGPSEPPSVDASGMPVEQ